MAEIVITGPDAVSEGVSTQITGILDTAATVTLDTEDGAFTRTQTITAQDATTVTITPDSGNSALRLAGTGTVVGVPMQATIISNTATPYTFKQVVSP